MLAVSRRYRAKNVEKCRARTNVWRQENAEYCRKRSRLYSKENRPYFRAQMALRKARLLQATPKWADLKAIEVIYQQCPPGFHVDHIIPLLNPKVCGLHVPWNLQHLTATENLSKGNRFE